MSNPRLFARRLAACLAAALLPIIMAPTIAAQSRPSPQVPILNWLPCGDAFPRAQCAVASVPLDYDRPGGAQIDLALARIPAANPEQKTGTVFINPGGPGGSGVDLAVFGFGDVLASLLDGRFDIVGFDPRGVARSTPLRCFATEEDVEAFLAPAPLFPYRADQKRPYYNLYRSLVDRCVDQRQRIADHMSTADVVRDLDLLRQAVGDPKLSYLGFSYGSYIGNTYANLFPKNVRALVIDGVLDPRLWSSGLQIVSDRVATAAEFDEFLRLCDEAGADCVLGRPGGAGARYAALLEAIRHAPFVFEDGFIYSYDFLIGDTVGAMYAPESWGGPEGFGAFLGFLSDAVLGDASALKGAQAVRRAIQDRLKAARPQRDDYDNSFEAYYGNQCADTQYPDSYRGFLIGDAYAEAGSIFGPYWWWGNTGCTRWPVAADRYVGPWSARTSAPVLVVGNFFDGVTDYAGAVASSQLLKNSRLLSYAGWGHTAFLRSACVTDYVLRYLSEGALPPEGTVCPANPNPFVDAAASALRRAAPLTPLIGLPPAWPMRH
jgi:pimeloyl-ACP methyl ester carboxylesterase